jgi:hypothetical protein
LSPSHREGQYDIRSGVFWSETKSRGNGRGKFPDGILKYKTAGKEPIAKSEAKNAEKMDLRMDFQGGFLKRVLRDIA